MKKRNKILLIWGIATALLLPGCGQPTEGAGESETAEKAEGTVVEKMAASVEDYKLRDKASVYEGDDETSVVTMYLTVRKGNEAEHTDHTWAEVNTYSKYWYEDNHIPQYGVEGILQIGDENGPVKGEYGYGLDTPNTIVKIRGQTSTKREQKNYKIEIKKEKGEWRGQRTINLNKHIGDGVRFRNKLAYDLMKEIPEMMSARTQFVHLYVKDETEGGNAVFEDYGLYTQVEQINRTYLKTHGLDNNGQLYKINFFEFFRYEDRIRLATDPQFDQKAFEEYVEIKGDTDHSKLIAMLEDVNDYAKPIEETMEKWFDTENLFYWMGFHILMGNDDTNARNYFLYSPLNVNKFYIISWDNDSSLKAEEDRINEKLTEGDWEYGLSNYWGNVLYERIFKNKEYRARLTAAVERLRTEYLTREKVVEKVDAYRGVVKPYAFQMPDILHESLTEAEYDRVADSFPIEIEENYHNYLKSLQKPMPFFISLPSLENGKMEYSWEAAYDFDSENIAYSFELASDYTFANPIYKQEGIRVPQVELDPLLPGQYFVRVIATNESGESQYAFDYYVLDSSKVFGTRCFYVLEDGSIGEDIYDEGA